MSELKSETAYFMSLQEGENVRVYLKDDVDAVLAEKDAEIRKLNFQMWSARFEAAEAECDAPRMARCRYMADKFKEVNK